MINSLLQLDRKILIYLNNLGSENWDPFWLYVTNQFNWIPVFIILLLVLLWKIGWKNTLLMLVFVAFIIAFTDQFTNLMKYTFGRIRPCNEPTLQGLIRDFTYKPRGFSYYSGHASLSTTITTFLVLLLRKEVKAIYLLIIFPLVFGYSRIYLGVHYPFDVLTGYIVGLFLGFLFYKLQKKLRIANRF